MELKVGNKVYQLKYGIRSLILFEKMADKPFSLEGTTDWIVFIYAMLLSGVPDAGITLDEFIDGLDLQGLNEAIGWASAQMRVGGQLEEDKDIKKKQ